MAKKPSSRTFPVEREVDGVKHAGTFTLEEGTIEVSLPGVGSKKARLEGATPQSLAGRLLAELAAEKRVAEGTPKKR